MEQWKRLCARRYVLSLRPQRRVGSWERIAEGQRLFSS
jgi:hypothetical protein